MNFKDRGSFIMRMEIFMKGFKLVYFCYKNLISEWKNGKRNGSGKFRTADGWVKIGDWKDNEF